jgi:geranylgeranyl reductase family protein
VSRFDVAIVGGGPAGAWAGFRLASSGLRVALFDGSHPREKPCGGGLTGRALSLVKRAVPLESLPSVPVSGAAFTHDARTATVPLSTDGDLPALSVASRRELDGRLLAAAIAAGVAHVPSRASDVVPSAAGWHVRTRSGTVEAAWILGADGANSLVRRRVARPFHRADLSIATGYFVHDRSSREIVVSFEGTPPGYLWSFPRPDHLAVGICAQADECTVDPLLERSRAWIESTVGPATLLERYSWPIPSLREETLLNERAAGDRWMLLGDAAGLVDPITREGIYFALRSADLAVGSLLEGNGAAMRYARRVRDEIHAELIRAARLKARFYRPSFMQLLLRSLQHSARIREVMADLVAGEQTYRGLRRRLLSTLELRLMIELFGM